MHNEDITFAGTTFSSSSPILILLSEEVEMMLRQYISVISFISLRQLKGAQILSTVSASNRECSTAREHGFSSKISRSSILPSSAKYCRNGTHDGDYRPLIASVSPLTEPLAAAGHMTGRFLTDVRPSGDTNDTGAFHDNVDYHNKHVKCFQSSQLPMRKRRLDIITSLWEENKAFSRPGAGHFMLYRNNKSPNDGTYRPMMDASSDDITPIRPHTTLWALDFRFHA